MNLLPKSLQEFRENEYWDKFFIKRKSQAFEWYGDYMQLCTLLHKYIRASDNVLVVGCGNSRLSSDMYDVGIHNITNIDISEIVIKQMSENSRHRSNMKWLRMDVTKMEFVDGQFSVVLDKGTLDALFTCDEEQIVQQVEKMFDEIERVLKVGGRFVCISLLQEHILDKILSWFLERGWMVRVCRRLDVQACSNEAADRSENLDFPVFVVVCTKFRKMPQVEPILEVALYSERTQRIGICEVKKAVQALQQFAFLKYQISKRTMTGEDVAFELFVEDNAAPRYSLFVVDQRSRSNDDKKFAIFIVPQGRETEWLFGSFGGRQQLAENAAYERLVIVHLNRNHRYDSLDAIKAELSSRIMELAPAGLNRKAVVPFLSVGDSLGKRNIVFEGTSAISGNFIVEDVEGDNQQTFRRLVFLENPNVIQSEAKLIPRKSGSSKKSKKSKKKLVVDVSYLACQHHVYMIASQVFLPHFGSLSGRGAMQNCLIIGLGGGGLPTFLHLTFPNLNIDVVEIDASILQLAKECFGFSTGDHMKVIVADGLKYIKEVNDTAYDIIMLDVDSKDTSIGMSCPPKSFVETENLATFRNILLENGIFVLNLVCRDATLRDEVINRVSETFANSYSYKIRDEVNEIVYGLKGMATSGDDLFSSLPVKLRSLNDLIKQRNKGIDEDLIEIETMMNSLTVLVD